MDDQVLLLLYTCADGILRERCQRHVAQHGPTAPVPGRQVQSTRTAARRLCTECFLEWSAAQAALTKGSG